MCFRKKWVVHQCIGLDWKPYASLNAWRHNSYPKWGYRRTFPIVLPIAVLLVFVPNCATCWYVSFWYFWGTAWRGSNVYSVFSNTMCMFYTLLSLEIVFKFSGNKSTQQCRYTFTLLTEWYKFCSCESESQSVSLFLSKIWTNFTLNRVESIRLSLCFPYGSLQGWDGGQNE